VHGKACELGIERRGNAEVPWGCLYRLGVAPGGGSPAGMAINGGSKESEGGMGI
jgi:hypothetical protein